MAANDNLIPQNKRTKEEQREIARKGGIASGKARKERKTLKEELLLLLEDEKIQKELIYSWFLTYFFFASYINVETFVSISSKLLFGKFDITITSFTVSIVILPQISPL